MTEPLSKINNLLIRLVRVLPERGMTGLLPEPEYDVAKTRGHPVLELLSVDKFVQSTMQDEVWKCLGLVHQSSFVLGMWAGPNPHMRILTSNGTHPAVFGILIELVSVSHAGLNKFFRDGSKISDGRIQELRNKGENPGGGDESLHVNMGEWTQQDNTPDEVDPIVCSDISGSNASPRPVNVLRIGSINDYLLNLPSSQDWPLVTDSKIVDDGLEILGILLGPVRRLVQRLIADSLTTNVISDLSYPNDRVSQRIRVSGYYLPWRG